MADFLVFAGERFLKMAENSCPGEVKIGLGEKEGSGGQIESFLGENSFDL